MSVNVHVIRTHRPHFGAHSGISQFLRHVDPLRHHVEVHVTADSDADFPIQNRWIRKILRYAVQWQGMEYYKLSDLVAEIKTLRKCWNSNVDIVHFIDGEHSAQYLPWLRRPNARGSTKFLATFHQPPNRLKTLTRTKVIEGLDHVTVVSPEQLAFFCDLLGPERVSLILHGIDSDYFRPGNPPQEEKILRCLSVGHWLRDFAAIREVARRLKSRKEIEFHAVVSNRILPRIPELEELENVTLHTNHLDDAVLLKLYQECHVLFLPLLGATANNALLEGIACGLPVLSTDLAAVRAYLPGNEAILIKDNEPQAFVDAILWLCRHPHIRKEMGASARKRAEELDWHKIAPQYEALYGQLVSHHARAVGSA